MAQAQDTRWQLIDTKRREFSEYDDREMAEEMRDTMESLGVPPDDLEIRKVNNHDD